MPAAKNPLVKPGYKFGHLTVESDTGRRKNGYIVWHCSCDCGGGIDLDKRTIERGTVTDCGCQGRLAAGRRDITGMRFGRLTAMYSLDRKAPNGNYYWHCVCDCGGEIDAPLHQLTSGYRKSCGCLSHPPLKDFVGRHFGRLTVTAYAGKEDGQHYWECRCDCGNVIKVRQTRLQSGHTRSCGCLAAENALEYMKFSEGTSVTVLEKILRDPTSTDIVSGRIGVYFDGKADKWVSRIGFKGKNLYLGTFEKKQDAIKARERAEEMYEECINSYYSSLN